MSVANLVESEGFKKFSSKLERMGSIVLLVGLFMHFFMPAKSSTILMVGFSTMAIVYFFKAFLKSNVNNKVISIIFNKVYGYSLALSLVSVLFTLQKWPISDSGLIFSLILLLIATYLSIKVKMEEKQFSLEYLHFIRLFVALALVVYAFFVK